MKRTSSAHVRMKIVALLAALAALWSFAAYVTVRDGLNLLFVNTLGDFGFQTSEVVGALQDERRLSAVALSDDRDGTREELLGSRERTDHLVAAWRSDAETRSVRIAAGDELEERIDEADTTLARLGEVRADVDQGEIGPAAAGAEITAMIDAGFDTIAAVVSLDDQELARQARSLVGLARSRELLSRQDALLSGALAGDEVTGPVVDEFAQLTGAQRFQFEATAAELHPDDLALYEDAVAGPEVTELRALEDRFMADARAGGDPPFPATRWRETVDAASAELRQVELAASDNAVERSTPIAIGVIVRLLLAGGLGLIAVIAAVVISVTTARSLVRQLERLRDSARELARNRLPTVVDRLSSGEQVDVASEAPPLRFGDDEIGQVGQAFNQVQETAVRAAVQQAELRHGVRDVFLSLARRTQGLVHKQLSVVDGMERRETDADEMEELYRIDHLATRMRRNAENLIVLSGASPGRTWRQPVSMIDVVRGAVAEVEDYTRVGLQPVDSAELDGRAVGDVIHLLAELIENAASYSPPYARVSVGGARVAHGFVVEIEDRGLGMSEDELVAANAKLTDPPDFSLADASRLGHYVVAKLAQRHGLRVHLRSSPYGGIVAIVLVPATLLAATGEIPGPHPAEILTEPAPAAPAAETPPEPGPEPAGPELLGSEPVGPESVGPEPAGHEPRHRGPVAASTASPTVSGSAAVPPAVPPQKAPRTPSGLPWRVRQASLPRQIRNGDEAATDAETDARPAGEEPAQRNPEQVRQMMRAYQHGTRRGRTEAGAPQSDDHQEG